jgi:hypothetical protein
LIADCVILGYSAGVIRPPWYPEELARAKTVGEKVLDLYLSQIEERVEEDKALLSQIISQARDSLAHSDSFIAVAEALWEAGGRFGEGSYSLSSTRAREAIALVVEAAARRERFDGKALISVSAGGSGMRSELLVDDSAGLLNDDDLTGISRIAAEHDLVGVVDIRVNAREAFPITPATIREQIASLEEDNQRIAESILSLRRASGFEELTGPGVVLLAFDAPEGYSYHEIVHDQDVRELTDALMAAGAAGVEIGGQRITVRSSVRCAGPVVLVNQRPIVVNPIVIKAVGDPELLERAVQEIADRFALLGKRLEVRRTERVSLAAVGFE